MTCSGIVAGRFFGRCRPNNAWPKGNTRNFLVNYKNAPAQDQQKLQAPPFEEVTILCKVWYEDGVWNSSAHDLRVAVFGKNVEQARKNLIEAVVCHLESLNQVGQLHATIQKLPRLSRKRALSIQDMSANEMLWKATARVPDYE